MNEMKLIELIQRELDGEITASEKVSLLHYISENAKAKEMYKHFLQTSELLDNIPEIEPSKELRAVVFAEINSLKYAQKRTQESGTKIKPQWSSRPMAKLAYAFAVGIFIGAIFSTAMLLNFTRIYDVDTNNLTGTIGAMHPIQYTIDETQQILLPEVMGKIILKSSGQQHGVVFNLDSKEKIEIVLHSSTDQFSILSLEPLDSKDISFKNSINSAKLTTESGNLHSVLYFTMTEKGPAELKVDLIRSEKILYTHTFSINTEQK